MKAVCNASPLIVLAKADLHGILPQLFSDVAVPRAVAEEIRSGPSEDAACRILQTSEWLRVVELQPPMTPVAGWQLGRGEAEVLEWARAHGDVEALLDDRAARRAAKSLAIQMCGSLGLVARAVRRGLLPSFSEAVERLHRAGLYIDPRIVKTVSQGLVE